MWGGGLEIGTEREQRKKYRKRVRWSSSDKEVVDTVPKARRRKKKDDKEEKTRSSEELPFVVYVTFLCSHMEKRLWNSQALQMKKALWAINYETWHSLTVGAHRRQRALLNYSPDALIPKRDTQTLRARLLSTAQRFKLPCSLRVRWRLCASARTRPRAKVLLWHMQGHASDQHKITMAPSWHINYEWGGLHPCQLFVC